MVPAAVVLVLAVIAGGFYFRKRLIVQLTDKDQIILADFTNQTGDAVFDSTLKEALAIQLEQSPMLQQTPDYPECILGTARAQAQFDKAAAVKSYQQLLEIWKNADADFIPAQEARRELVTLLRN